MKPEVTVLYFLKSKYLCSNNFLKNIKKLCFTQHYLLTWVYQNLERKLHEWNCQLSMDKLVSLIPTWGHVFIDSSDRGQERKREASVNCLPYVPWQDGIHNSSMCPTGNQTCDLSVHRWCSNQLSIMGQG